MSNRAIIDAVKAISGAGNPVASLHVGTVIAVDEDDYTCTCRLETGGGVDMSGVKLMLNPDDGVVGFPAIDSQVLIILQSPGDPYVIMTTELDKLDSIANVEIYNHVGKTTLQLLPDKIALNDGRYGGIPIADKITERLNAIESDLNTLKSKITNWTAVLNDGGSALREALTDIPGVGPMAAPGSWAASKLEETDSIDLQNNSASHGEAK